MNIYSYNGTTGEYIGFSEAYADPLESKKQGMFIPIIPANSTTVAPPEFGENQIPVFQNGVWNIIPDYRGQKQVNILTREITEVKNPGELEPEFQLVSEELADDLQKNPNKYEVIDGHLMDISNGEKYKQALAENNERYWNKKFIQTKYGWLKINTDSGTILSVLSSMEVIVKMKGSLPANSISFYSTPDFTKELSEEYLDTLKFRNEEMDFETFQKLFNEAAEGCLERFKGE